MPSSKNDCHGFLGTSTNGSLTHVGRLMLLPVFILLLVAATGFAQQDTTSVLQQLPSDIVEDIPDYLIQGEAPTSLFQTKLGDAAVDLLAAGSWQSNLALSLSLGLYPSLGNGAGYRWLYPFPWPTIGSTGLLYLNNSVDLTLSLWILKRYFFETTFVDQFALNTFLFGYQGHGNEFVQKILVGNALMPFSQYPYLPIGGVEYSKQDNVVTAGDLVGANSSAVGISGASSTDNTQSGSSYTGVANTLALSALFRTDKSTHELLLEYQNNSLTKQSYLGTNEVIRTHINPGSYVNGQYFVLPDTDIDNLQIYEEDTTGTITASNAAGGGTATFKKVDPSQVAVYSLSDGTIFFREPLTTRVLITYTKGGVRVGTSTSLGRNAAYGLDGNGRPDQSIPIGFSWNTTTDSAFNALMKQAGYSDGTQDVQYTVNGTDCLLLWQPGSYSPFALANQYDVTSEINNPSVVGSTVSMKAFIVAKNTATSYSLSPARSAVVVADDYRISVVDGSDSNLHDAANRYPFVQGYPSLYGLTPDTTPSYTPFDILLEQEVSRTAVTIDTTAIPGTVHITINGRDISTFTVNYSTGVISFPFPILATDDIEISYQTASGGSSGGQLVFGSGNTLQLADNLLLDLAIGSRWSILGSGYTTEPDEAPGSIVASTRLAYKAKNLSGMISAGVSVSTPDTSGTLLLAGMGDDNTTLSVDATRLLPSAVPTELDSTLGTTLSQDNRGKLFYVDYGESILGGIQLQPYDWSAVPQSQVYAYANGSRIGPYATGAGTDGPSGQLMAVDYSLSTSKPWVAGDLSVPSGSDLDLSSAKGIAVTWKSTASAETGNSDGTVRVFLQIGALGEDRDGNGVLDVGTSTANPGFPFHDSSHGITLLAGGPPWTPIIHTEDTNGNGVLDSEGGVVTMELTTAGSSSTYAAPPASFQRKEFIFTAAQRAELRDVRGVRVIVYDSGSTDADGRILVGDITVEGTSFTATTTSTTGTLTVRATNESQLDPAKLLVDAYPETSSMLAGTTDQTILLASWSGFSSTDTWSAVHYTTAVPDDEYGSLVLYVAPKSITKSAGTPELTIHYDYGDTPGLTATVPLPAVSSPPVWNKVLISLTQHKVYVDGNATSGTVSFTQSGNDFTRLEIDGVNMSAGTLAIDQIHLSSPISRVGAGAQLTGTWNVPGTILQSGSVKILSDATLTANAYARTSGFASLAAQSNAQYAGVALNAGATVLDTRLQGGFSADGGVGNVATSGSHTITFPATPAPVTLTDSFLRAYSDTQPVLFRQDGVTANIPSLVGITLSTQASFPGTLSESGNTGTLSQQWAATIASLWAGSFSLQSGLTMTNSSDFVLDSTASYPAAWVQSFRYALPYSGDASAQRTATATTDLAFNTKVTKATLSLLADYQTQYAVSGSSGTTVADQQLSEGKITLSVPINLVPAQTTQPGILAGLTLTPSYTRDVYVAGSPPEGWSALVGSQTANPSSVLDFRLFGNDFGYLGESIWSQHYFFQSVPVADIFQPGLVDEFTAESAGKSYAAYEPAVALILSRSVGSTPWDFIIPNQAQISLGRELERQADAISDTNTIDISLTHAAINVFGRLGAYPLFSFYRSEDFSSALDLSFKTSTTQDGLYWSIYHVLSTTLYVTKADTVALNNRFSVDAEPDALFSDEGEVSFSWQTHPSNLLGVKVLNAALAKGAYFVHTESLTANWSEGTEGSDLTFTVGHKSAFTLPKKGEVALFGRLGVSISPYSTTDSSLGNVVVLGLQVGISGKLNF